MAKILVSACLLGCKTRYDGKSTPCEKVLELAKDNVLIPICPEQMGGMTTPRTPSERQRKEDGSLKSIEEERAIITKDGKDVTAEYAAGVDVTLQIAKLNNVDYAILKSCSPSCGIGSIYDGSFTGAKAEGDGITAETLKKAGFKVISELDL